ncbi:MAG: DUF982 domain-containing protein [Mesorhizobium sp.]|nr:MAG: DUF982 domain-containing protein [Mesorhizobium sp.]
MSAFLPIRIRFVDGRLMLVSSIRDAETALGGQWNNKETPAFKEATRLLAAAKEGRCTPRVAFLAFERAAREQRMVQSVEGSAALKMYDELVGSLFRR